MNENDKQIVKRKYPLKRIYSKIVFYIARKCPFLRGEFRASLFKSAGVKIEKPSVTFIGFDVAFDDICPENISVGQKTMITEGVKILSHFIDVNHDDLEHMYFGKVEIGSNVFIGMNTVIVRPVTIGNGAIIGANSVITKDIPPYTIWGGNPAKFIKNREINQDSNKIE
ncbi:MAG: hypothetical protein A2W98_01255 [Bacteroidetes bacterium GWF2_33_38]|nr:MAG: hypothetical protein A2W98_01255 [Bacteroidetes bacterium GWF2_33_38]OFY92189.1 MAG: hypothetical protein A2236_02900 [Bacteroidetes bacterium RIFOXYA2_FULL_33_7]HBX50578.1 acyltransferase [Bacteroidales bacterium]